MKFNVHTTAGSVISLEDVDDFAFDSADATFTFHHFDETLSVIPREHVLLIKELSEGDKHSIN